VQDSYMALMKESGIRVPNAPLTVIMDFES
jgi:hypothetical protein